MSKWHSFLEYLQFPLKVLFFATLLLGIGTLLTNPYLGLTELFETDILIKITNIMKYIGGFIIKMFPLLVFLKVLTRKYEDSAPVFIGFVSLIVITIMMMVLSTQEYASYYYTNTLGIELNIISSTNNITGQYSPYNTGILSIIISYFITSYAYRRSRRHIRHGYLYFVDHDTWAVLVAIALSVITGIALSIVWPWIIFIMEAFFKFVSSDIYDVGRMFFYGIIERISCLFNLEEISRSVFWLSEAGGSCVGTNGIAYLGESGLWQAFLLDSTQILKTGHFTAIYYIINIAFVPAFVLAYYKLMGKGKRKYLVFIILAVLFSLLCGISLPIELLMIVLSPLLYVFYLLLIGIAYALIAILGSLPGYSAPALLFTAMPGSIIDLIYNLPNKALFSSTVILLVLCVVFFIVFYLATIIYFKKYAIGFLSMNDVHKIVEEAKIAMGGVENIVSIETTPDKMIVAFRSRDIVDIMKLHELGAYLILESKEGYTIRMKNINVMVGDIINKELKEKEGK